MTIAKVIHEEGSRPIKIWTNDIEGQALNQLHNLAKLPFIAKNGVACMPDVHAGIGSTVGTVIATEKAVIPAAVGVDIGCGMCAVKTSLTASDLPDSLAEIRHSIERGVPTGMSGHTNPGKINHNITAMAALSSPTFESFKIIANRIYKGDDDKVFDKAGPQVGTLGGGNHFIEICIDEVQNVWVMLHSGSRGIGNAIGRHFIQQAKEEMERWHIHLPDTDLAYLPEGSQHFHDYVEAVGWAQRYAFLNRQVMLTEVLRNMHHHIPKPFTVTDEAINCHHNYIERENHFGKNLYVTRKGAIRARKDDLGIIPGSMGQRSYIVRGLGNVESYNSCSHGAGRIMSRTEARKRFTIEDLKAQTAGVECRKDDAVLDEIPSSYKSIDEVMANQTDLVETVAILKQVLCVKGG